jgi:F0F1-type ATP synthase assembly protein I
MEHDQSGPRGVGFIFLKMPENKDKIVNIKDFAVGMAIYSSASVFGPLLIFGGIGYFLDKKFNGHHIILLSGILIAFIITNILIFRKAGRIAAEMKNFHGNGKNGYDEDDDDKMLND